MRYLTFLSLLPAVVAALTLNTVRADTPENETEEYWMKQAEASGRTLCFMEPDDDGDDDGPAITNALTGKCRSNSIVVFSDDVFHINSHMTTDGLSDVQIHQFGRLLWSTDIEYWLNASTPVNFQNQSTAWYFGGNKVIWDGYGKGTFDGNGQVWYDWAKGEGNKARRPINVNFRKLTNSTIKRMRFVQSQMWTMVITYSKNVLLEDIFVHSVSNSQWNTLNTDGCDTVYSDNITFRRWDITNGDDGIALKSNSSNIFVYDSIFHGGQGLAIGSMGQYEGKYEYLENFYANNLTMHSTSHVLYLKTWAGIRRGYPPNGGGGGFGHAKNITVNNVVLDLGRDQPLFSWQCENYSGHAGQDCNSSLFKMQDLYFRNISGTTMKKSTNAGSFSCSSAAGGCENIVVENFTVRRENETATMAQWHCANVHGNRGFNCTN